MSAPAASWCDPAGGSPAQVRSSVRLVASVARPLATVVAKRTQRLHVDCLGGKGDTAMSTAREGTGARGDHGALQRLHLGLGLLEPELHAHVVEQAHRCREMFGHPSASSTGVRAVAL